MHNTNFFSEEKKSKLLFAKIKMAKDMTRHKDRPLKRKEKKKKTMEHKKY